MKAALRGSLLAGLLAGACAPAAPERGEHGRDEPPPWFEDVARSAGLHFVHDSGHRGRHFMPEIMGGGAALFDMDGDGDLDAYLVQGRPVEGEPRAPRGNQLFRGDGTGRFVNVSEGSGAEDAGNGMGVAVGDVDEDGLPDLYVTNVGANVLLRNLGEGRFEDVTRRAGVGDLGWGSSAAFADLDQDGDLDLAVVNYLEWRPETEIDCRDALLRGEPGYCEPSAYDAPATDRLYRNDGGLRFTDVSEASGFGTLAGTGLGLVVADFDGDGRPDLFVANDGMLDRLWLNRGGLRFEERGLESGCAVDEDGTPKAGMGVDAADTDEDGDEDLLVVNLVGQSDSYFRNDGGWFVDVAARRGLAGGSRQRTRFGVGWRDFDNDGRLDLYEACGRVGRAEHLHSEDPYAEPNLAWRGVGEGRLEELAPVGGTAEPLIGASRAAAFGDVDGDGGVDVLLVERDAAARLLRNVVPRRGRWSCLEVLERSGRPALGAGLRLRVDERWLHRQVRSAASYQAANDPRVHVGLGAAERVDEVEVTWADGEQQLFGAAEAGRCTTLRRASREAGPR